MHPDLARGLSDAEVDRFVEDGFAPRDDAALPRPAAAAANGRFQGRSSPVTGAAGHSQSLRLAGVSGTSSLTPREHRASGGCLIRGYAAAVR
jgi:hypothetical protein